VSASRCGEDSEDASQSITATQWVNGEQSLLRALRLSAVVSENLNSIFLRTVEYYDDVLSAKLKRLV
jgi:hypothetical protein